MYERTHVKSKSDCITQPCKYSITKVVEPISTNEFDDYCPMMYVVKISMNNSKLLVLNITFRSFRSPRADIIEHMTFRNDLAETEHVFPLTPSTENGMHLQKRWHLKMLFASYRQGLNGLKMRFHKFGWLILIPLIMGIYRGFSHDSNSKIVNKYMHVALPVDLNYAEQLSKTIHNDSLCHCCTQKMSYLENNDCGTSNTPYNSISRELQQIQADLYNLKQSVKEMETRVNQKNQLSNATQEFYLDNYVTQDKNMMEKIDSLLLADKTGMVDYALESAGGEILPQFTTKGLSTKHCNIKFWYIPLCYKIMSARIAIQPNVYPGNCFTFKGQKGQMALILARRIIIQNITVEHIPQKIAIGHSLDSAPKDILISGFGAENLIHLTTFQYNIHGKPVQTFMVKSTHSYQKILLQFNTNWGNLNYTCVYRIRVHGEPSNN